jgi:hypothetical protein
MNKESTAFLSFQEDISNRSFSDWIEAHISFLKPLHRYEGVIHIDREKLSFYGREKKTGMEFQISVFRYEFQQLYLGFDNVFTPWETRSFGMGWKPLRIVFTKEGKDYTMYLIIGYNGWRTESEAWMDLLKEWLL